MGTRMYGCRHDAGLAASELALAVDEAALTIGEVQMLMQHLSISSLCQSCYLHLLAFWISTSQSMNCMAARSKAQNSIVVLVTMKLLSNWIELRSVQPFYPSIVSANLDMHKYEKQRLLPALMAGLPMANVFFMHCADHP